MESVIVTTKEELKIAKDQKVKEIIVKGKLANQLKKAKKITKLSAFGLIALSTLLGVGTVAAPSTGGVSMGVSMAVAVSITGMEIAAILFVIFMGIGLIIAIFKEYEEISYENGKMVLRRKQFKK